ncbi:MAG: hypothetical protein M3423_01050 [Actinomycetota bacterium]|nr:hypothetical protein [Actinomycetota bacterium]
MIYGDNAMYEMYPEWEPARGAEDHPTRADAWTGPLQESMDLRDQGGERPGDH